jgi:hypothetical protein
MPEIGEQTPLNPLYPIKPTKPTQRRERPKPLDEKPERKPKQRPTDDGKPHVDEYA